MKPVIPRFFNPEQSITSWQGVHEQPYKIHLEVYSAQYDPAVVLYIITGFFTMGKVVISSKYII
jgi:hypothetical protein